MASNLCTNTILAYTIKRFYILKDGNCHKTDNS